MKGDRRLAAYLVVQGVVAAGSFALPITLGGAVRLAGATAGVVILAWAVTRRHPKRPVGWWLIALSAGLGYLVAAIVAATYGLGHGERLGSVLQFALAIASLCALAGGLATLGWR